MAATFSPYRFIHQRTGIHLPSTIRSAGDHKDSSTDLDPDFKEASFDHLDLVGMSDGGTIYCADAIRTFEYGA